MGFEEKQKLICRKNNADFAPTNLNLKLGVSQDFFDGKLPVNGLRLNEEGGTCGWFLWVGEELSVAGEYFQPLHHALHLIEKKRIF